MRAPVLMSVVPDVIWVSERPVWFSGVRLRARTTVVRLEDGGLLIHSPSDPTDAWCRAIDQLGEVRFLVVPNCFHHLGTPACASRFAAARVVGPRSATLHNRALELHGELTDPAFVASVPEFEVIEFLGCPFLDETVFFHRPTGTLIGTDILISACSRDHFTWRWAARLTGRYERVRTPPDVQAKTLPSEELARTIDHLAALPLERVLVAHADPIDARPAEQLVEAWRSLLPSG